MDITIDGLRKLYGDTVAVSVPHIHVSEGEVLGFVGNNGAGKTTLFRLLLDLVRADEGRVCIGGVNVAHSEEWKDYVGAFLDESFLIDYLTPQEFFAFVRSVSGRAVGAATSWQECFAPLLRDVPEVLIRELSAGNRQKVGIASAFLLSPQVVVLDEPFNFLDPSSQFLLCECIAFYRMCCPEAILLVSSHNIRHLADISTRIALMEHGSIVRTCDTSVEAIQEIEQYFSTTYA